MVKFNKVVLFGIFFLLSVALFFSCQKEESFNSDPNLKLGFSSDSVLFDTVFTTIGSTTKYLMVYNTSSQAIKISNIKLELGTVSQFRINVDGEPGISINNAEIAAKDSM